MRFCILVIAKSSGQAGGIFDARNRIIANATAIDHATRLWHVFQAVITGALDELKIQIGDLKEQIMKTIERTWKTFLCKPCNLMRER